jgi:hypothetical protein
MTADRHPGRLAAISARRAHEPRWPVVVTLVILLGLLVTMPERLRLMPQWVLYVTSVVVVAPLIMVAIRPESATFRRIERITTLAFVAFAAFGDMAVLRTLLLDILRNAQAVTGLQLLASSVAIWLANIVTFSLLFWQMDRGGPTGRERSAPCRPDWLFPQEQLDEGFVRSGWKPDFVDYLYLGFSTATAFSTTDVPPLSGRAKMGMMAESAISLLTLVVVAARAINVLG